MCSSKQEDNPRQLKRLIDELRLEAASLRGELQSQHKLQAELSSAHAD